jgi:hypothetical protein
MKQEISKFLKKLVTQKNKVSTFFDATGNNENGKIEVRRNHWPEGKTIFIPSNFDASPGEVVKVDFARSSNQLPFARKRPFSGFGASLVEDVFSIGQWGQSWGNAYRNAIGYSFSFSGNFVDDFAGSESINLIGEPSGGGLIRSILVLPEGKVGIIKFIEDGIELDKVRVITASTSITNNWNVLDYHDFELTLGRDRFGGQGYLSDCYAFFDEQTNFITVFTRMFNSLPDGVSDTDEATVLTVSALNPSSLSSPNIGSIKVSSAVNSINRLTARCMNLFENTMVKGAFDEIIPSSLSAESWEKSSYVFSYTQNTIGEWSLNEKVDWLNIAMNTQFSPRYSEPDNRPSYLASDVKAIGKFPEDFSLSNNRPQYGPPFARLGGLNYFFGVASCVKQIGVSNLEIVGSVATNYTRGLGFAQNKVIEIQINANSGSVSFSQILLENSYTQGQATKMANAIAAKAADYPPLFEPSSFSEERIASCFGDNYPYTYTEQKFYLGAIFAPYVNPFNSEDVRSPDLGESKFCGVAQSNIWPNYSSGTSGRRYGAITRSRPFWIAQQNLALRRVLPGEVKSEVYIPHQESSQGDNFSLQAFPFIQTGTPCGVAIRREYNGVYIPRLVHMESTFLFSIGPGISSTANLLELPHSNHEFFVSDPSIPIREEFFQAIPIDELGIVLWLHNWRDSKDCALGIPMITVTNIDATSVLFEIPASEFFPVTKFDEDRYYSAESSSELWARSGEFDHYCNNINGLGPLMKVVKIGTEYKIILSVEYYKRVFPGDYGYAPTNGFDTFGSNNSEGEDGVTFLLSNGTATISKVYVNEEENEVPYTFEAPNKVILSTPIAEVDIVAIEYTWAVEGALPPEAGETWVKSFVIGITESEYVIEKEVSDSIEWTLPLIERPSVNFGIEELRLMAVCSDRVILGMNQIKT